MTELELKFRLPPGARAALLKAVGNHGLATQSLAARYFDTPDALLARHRMALRLRAEDGRWVQTLKASLPDSMERLEDEVDVGPADAEPGPPDPSRHAAGEAGRRLLDLLERHPGSVLAEGFRTEVERRKRRLESHGATIEWALDEGRVVAGGRVHAIDELELELKGGDAAGLYAAARDWVARHGLWLDTVSKAERGHLLAHGRAHTPPARAEPPVLGSGHRLDARKMLRAIVAACLAQVLPNAAALIDGSADPEHVHQLRVGLRRLRTALREFDAQAPALAPETRQAVDAVFDAAGELRDRHVMLATLAPRLDRAGAPLADPVGGDEDSGLPDLAARLRGSAFQLALLRLLAFSHDAEPAVEGGEPDDHGADEDGRAALPHVRRRLSKLRRQVVRDATHFDALAFDEQHRVRKRLKRLRYLASFVAPLFPKRRVSDWLEAVEPAQDALGRHIDQAVAAARFEAAAAHDARAWFAVGWLRARLKDSAREGRRALEKLRKADPFW